MKKIIAIVFLAASCSSDIHVFTDYDKDHDVRTYPNYRWAEIKNIENGRNPIYYNELNDKRIKTAVNKQLLAKGYSESPEKAELVIHYHIIVSDMMAYRDNTDLHHDASWLRPEIAYYKYNEGTLIFDIMDLSNCLVWRGYATQILDDINPQFEEMKINEAVVKIFSKFPKQKNDNEIKLQ